jgi:cell division protein FtsA
MLTEKKVATVVVGKTPHTNGTAHMATETGMVVAIDVGTTKVCTIVGRRSGSKGIHVLGHSTVPCNGLRKGNVVDEDETGRAVRESVQEVERATGIRVESAFVGVTGSHISFENRRDRLELAGENGVVTADDLNRQSRWQAGSSNETDRKLIHAVRMSYSLDGEAGIRNPLGMHSSDIEVETHFVTGDASFIDRLVQAVERAGIQVDSLVLEPLASGLAVLTPEEKERGAMLVDIGGGTTDVVGFKRGRIYYTGSIPVGGYQFTNDIALTFNTPYEAAEAVKLQHASTELHAAASNEEISLPVIGQNVLLRVPRLEICQLTRERGQELARMIKLHLDDARIGNPSDIQFVLTGGASNMPGLARLIERTLAIPVRRGVPNVRGTIPDELKDPAFATSVGILMWAATEYVSAIKGSNSRSDRTTEVGPKGFLSSLFRRIGRMMPDGLFAAMKGRF